MIIGVREGIMAKVRMVRVMWSNRQQTFTYDANTVLPTNVEDYNGDDTAMTYEAISRPLVTTLNSGAKTTVTYND